MLGLVACTGTTAFKPDSGAGAAPAGESLALEKGQADLAAEDYKNAQVAFQELLHRDPQNIEAQLGLGEVKLAIGRFQEAERIFSRLSSVAGDPGWRVQALEAHGLTLIRLGRPSEAKADFLAAIEEQPGLARSWNGLGQVYDASQDWPAARQAYQRALAIRPEWAGALNNLGVSLLAAGNAVGAEQQFAKALQLQPKLDVTDMNLRLAVAAQGRYQEALAGGFRERQADIMNDVGYIALLRGDSADAEQLFRQALALSPSLHRQAQRNLDYLTGRLPVTTAADAP
jgi:Flp pilus assembly protein TadD